MAQIQPAGNRCSGGGRSGDKRTATKVLRFGSNFGERNIIRLLDQHVYLSRFASLILEPSRTLAPVFAAALSTLNENQRLFRIHSGTSARAERILWLLYHARGPVFRLTWSQC